MQDELALRGRRDEGRPGRGGVAAVVGGEDDERRLGAEGERGG